MAAENKQGEIWESDAWKALASHCEDVKKQHLRDLLNEKSNAKLKEREESLKATFENIHLDSTRQQCDDTTMNKLIDLANTANLCSKIEAMFSGEAINKTENRSVLHVALRAAKDQKIVTPSNNEDQVPKVHKVLDQIKNFSNEVRRYAFPIAFIIASSVVFFFYFYDRLYIVLGFDSACCFVCHCTD